jgi:hypothetical protein
MITTAYSRHERQNGRDHGVGLCRSFPASVSAARLIRFAGIEGLGQTAVVIDP